MSENNFQDWLVVQLKQYLKDRAVVYSTYRKEQLVELCVSADRLNLPVDPNFFNDSIVEEIKKNLDPLSTFL